MTQVAVIVADKNDNAPSMKQSVYKVNISESAPVGSLLLTVSGEDKDMVSCSQSFELKLHKQFCQESCSSCINAPTHLFSYLLNSLTG